ncbi:MAG: class I SAM-dependent methyltransferase [Alkalispirochaeta sp.]
MSDSFWNDQFADSEFRYGTKVNAWVEEAVGRYVLNGHWFANLGVDSPDELSVIELAAGEGRNSVWLAEQQFQVTAFDQSPQGGEKTRRLAAHRDAVLTIRTDDAIDLGLNSPGWQGYADVVISTFFHTPPDRKRAMFTAHRNLVRPGGLVIAEWFHPDQRLWGYTSGGPPQPEMMVSVPELRTAFGEWHILECRVRLRELSEGYGHVGEGIVTQFAAQKPVSWR